MRNRFIFWKSEMLFPLPAWWHSIRFFWVAYWNAHETFPWLPGSAPWLFGKAMGSPGKRVN